MLKLFTADFITDLLQDAHKQTRQRSHHNVHQSLDDPAQKLFVAATADSYFRPHRHPDKSEFALIIDGQFDILLFDDSGNITSRQRAGVGTDVFAIEIPANTWHGWVTVSEQGAFFEVKRGPYIRETAAQFADWAPAEGSEDAAAYLQQLRS